MANKLKNLSVTSVDLVDQGANPDAHIRLFKRKEKSGEADPDMGLFRKFAHWLKNGYADAADPDVKEGVEKDARAFNASLGREGMQCVTNEAAECCYALLDSFCSILHDDALDIGRKKALMSQSLDEFVETVQSAAGEWAAGKKMRHSNEDGTGASEPVAQMEAMEKLLGEHGLDGGALGESQDGKIEKEEMDTMQMDKGKMMPEERAFLEELEKKYGTPDSGKAAEETDGAGGNRAGRENGKTDGKEKDRLHPEVAKAIADFREVTKRQSAEIEGLKKSLEMERLTAMSKKYETLGKKAPELAEKLYELKKAGGSVYDDYVALLDENLTALEKSGLFAEIGSGRQGIAGSVEALGDKALELRKSAAGGMEETEALIKAWEENPELAAQYEAEYMGR